MAKVKIVCRGRCNKDGEAPVEISVSHKGKTAYIKTAVSVSPGNWCDTHGSWVSGMKNAKSLNSALEDALTRAKAALIKIENSTGTRGIDCNTLRDMLSPDYDESNAPKVDIKRTLGYRWKLYTSALNQETKTTHSYKSALRSITCFDKSIESKDIDCISKEWLSSYKEWMIKEGVWGKGNKPNTISSNLRCLKAVINDAIDDEVIYKNPFKKFPIKTAPTDERPMTEAELRLVFGCKKQDSNIRPWIDLFIMCFYLRGINMIDLSKITEVDNNGYINYIRTKTESKRPTKVSIKVEPEIKELLDKYKGNDHLLRMFDEHSYEQVSRIMVRAIIRIDTKKEYNEKTKRMNLAYSKSRLKDVQQYSTRRTWATIAYNKCGIPMDVISLCLGHKDMGLAVTMRYVRPDQKVIDEANRKVIDYLNKLKL